MKKGIVIATFATCGKSFLGQKYQNVIDLDSINYKYINENLELSEEAQKGTKRELNKEWPDNYYQAINGAVKKYDIVLIPLKPEYLDYFDKNNIKYSIAYPDINDWESVAKKCILRGNNEYFIKKLQKVFLPYYKDACNRNYEKLYIIPNGENLESVLIKDNIELKRKEDDEFDIS